MCILDECWQMFFPPLRVIDMLAQSYSLSSNKPKL